MKRILIALFLIAWAAAFVLTGCSDKDPDSAPESDTLVARINDVDNLPGKFFFLADPDSAMVPLNLIEIRLYLDDLTAQNDADRGARLADAWLDPASKTPSQPVRGLFHLLLEGPTDEYVFLENGTESSGLSLIVLKTPIQRNQRLAVAYRQLAGPDTVDVGTFDPTPGDSILDLKMLQPAERDWDTDATNDLRTSRWAPARRLEFKNAYYLGARNIDPATLRLSVVRDVAGAGGDNPSSIENEFGKITPLTEILGLDQKNNADPSDRVPDGRVDPEYVDYENGILFFPDLRPFDPSLVDIAGHSEPGYRNRSWPRATAESRPDTLGWKVSGGMAVPSDPAVREAETVPEIYDLLRSSLIYRAADYHLYTIEVRESSAP